MKLMKEVNCLSSATAVTYIDHHKTMHAKALQRSKYMALDNGVDDQNKFVENL